MRNETALARTTDPLTAQDAAASVNVAQLEALCLSAIRKAADGLTSEELAKITGLPLVTVSPRLRPLANKRLIQEAGKRRNQSGRSAIIWLATQ